MRACRKAPLKKRLYLERGLCSEPATRVQIPAGALVFKTTKKMLKCPKCGFVFKAPLMDKKIFGYGWTFPYLGVIECPNYHYTAPRKDFEISNK